jgi:hypothetical protein
MRKPGLTVDDHKLIGSELRGIHDKLVYLVGDLSNSYPKNSSLVKSAEAALKKIDHLRAELDSRLAVEHPGEFDVHVYYGHTS